MKRKACIVSGRSKGVKVYYVLPPCRMANVDGTSFTACSRRWLAVRRGGDKAAVYRRIIACGVNFGVIVGEHCLVIIHETVRYRKTSPTSIVLRASFSNSINL